MPECCEGHAMDMDLHWSCQICCFMERLDKKELVNLREGLSHPYFRVTSPRAWKHETNLQSTEPPKPWWSAWIRSWSAVRVAGPEGRGAGRPRKASWSRTRVGVEGSQWGQGNAPSVRSAPESYPVHTSMQTQLSAKILNRRAWLSLFFESHVAINVSRRW